MKIFKLILSVLLVCCIGYIIFGFSASVGEESASFSLKITKAVLNIFNPGWVNMPNADEFLDTIHIVFRKIGHFSEYAAFGFSLCFMIHSIDAFSAKESSNAYCFTAASVLGVLYAFSDEIHQLYVPGRAGMLTDVLIDSCGVIFGVSIFILVLTIIRKIIRKRSLK